MARPRLQDDMKLSAHVNVPLRAADKAALARMASSRRQTLAGYLRSLITRYIARAGGNARSAQ